MIKILGIIIVILSGTAVGLKASDNLVLQNDKLKKLKQMLIILRGEIRFNHSVIPQALINVSKKTDELYKDFLNCVAAKLEKMEGKALNDIWRECVEEKLGTSCLEKKHLEKLIELGNSLGHLDNEMQLSYIDNLLEQISADIDENNMKMKENCKLYKTLGVMGGILVVLIIS